MRKVPGPKNKNTEDQQHQDTVQDNKADPRKESSKEEPDMIPVDNDAQNYFDAEDEDQELRKDDNRDLPL